MGLRTSRPLPETTLLTTPSSSSSAVMWAGSLIRDLRHTTILGIVSAGTMFVCFLLVVIGHGVQGEPNGFIEGESSTAWTLWAPEGTTFVSGMSAFLNIGTSLPSDYSAF